MKKIITYRHFGFLAIIALFVVSCESEPLGDVMVNEDLPNVSLALENMIEISDGTNFTLDNDKLTIPVAINFTGAAPKAFTVQMTAQTDTIATLVSAGTLAENTVALVQGEFTLPPVIDIAFGVKSVTFDLIVSRTFMERNYGKEIALAVKMNDPAKGNSIDPAKSTTIIVIKTGQTMTPDEVHYISFNNAGNQVLIPGAAYSMGSQNMLIPLELTLSGEAGVLFTVDVVANNDTINTLIRKGALQNTVLMGAKNFSVETPKVRFTAGKNTATVNLLVNYKELMLIKLKKVALALTLRSPSKFQTNATKKTVVVVFNQDSFRPYTGTPFVISGTIGQASNEIYAAYYDFGGEGVAYHDNGGRDGSDFRRPDEVDSNGSAPPYVVGWTGSGEWLSYSVNVEETGEYELNAIIGSPDNKGRFSVSFNDVIVADTLAVKQTPGNYGDQQPNYYTLKLQKGLHIMKIYMDNATYDVRSFIFTRRK